MLATAGQAHAKEWSVCVSEDRGTRTDAREPGKGRGHGGMHVLGDGGMPQGKGYHNHNNHVES